MNNIASSNVRVSVCYEAGTHDDFRKFAPHRQKFDRCISKTIIQIEFICEMGSKDVFEEKKIQNCFPER